MDRQEIVRDIQSHLSYDRELKTACLDIFNYLLQEDPNDLEYLTIKNLQDIANVDLNIIFNAINYLTKENKPLLSIGYEYINHDECYQLSPDEVSIIQNGGPFYYNGYLIKEWKSKVFIYFHASDLLKELS